MRCHWFFLLIHIRSMYFVQTHKQIISCLAANAVRHHVAVERLRCLSSIARNCRLSIGQFVHFHFSYVCICPCHFFYKKKIVPFVVVVVVFFSFKITASTNCNAFFGNINIKFSRFTYIKKRKILVNKHITHCSNLQGVYLANLTAIEENADFLGPQRRVNFNKMWMIGRIFSAIIGYQRQPYKLTTTPRVAEYFSSLVILDEGLLKCLFSLASLFVWRCYCYSWSFYLLFFHR